LQKEVYFSFSLFSLSLSLSLSLSFSLFNKIEKIFTGYAIVTQMRIKHGGATVIITDNPEVLQTSHNAKSNTNHQNIEKKSEDTVIHNESMTNKTNTENTTSGESSHTKTNSNQEEDSNRCSGGTTKDLPSQTQLETTTEQRHASSSGEQSPLANKESNSENGEEIESHSDTDSRESSEDDKHHKKHTVKFKHKKEKKKHKMDFLWVFSTKKTTARKRSASVAGTKNAVTIEHRVKIKEDNKENKAVNNPLSLSQSQAQSNTVVKNEAHNSVVQPHSNVSTSGIDTQATQNPNDIKEKQPGNNTSDNATSKGFLNSDPHPTTKTSENITSTTSSGTDNIKDSSQQKEPTHSTHSASSSQNTTSSPAKQTNTQSTLSSFPTTTQALLSPRMEAPSIQQTVPQPTTPHAGVPSHTLK
jgi:hypothetical protein